MRWKNEIGLLVLSMILFLPFLGSVHLFDWDEINFAESAREMLITQNWFQVQINFEPFWEKPPLFFWMQVLSMKLFGINEYAARFPNAVAGIIAIQVMYAIGKKWHGTSFGIIWSLLYLGSFLPHLYFKSGIIDPWFNLFIFLSIYFLYLTIEHGQNKQHQNAALAGVFSGLAILTKGPVGFLLLLLTFLVWWVFNRFKKPAKLSAILLFASSTAIVSSFWFGYETLTNGPWFLVEFFNYQLDLFLHPVAGHKQPFFYHFLVVLLGCFPLSVLALPVFSRRFNGDSFHLSRWMKYLFWVVMILFTLVTTKIVHYSSMAYIPLSYLAALVVYRLIKDRNRLPNWQNIWLLIQGSILAIAIGAVPIALMTKARWSSMIQDEFAQGNLSVPVDVAGWEWIVGLLYLILVGYCFMELRTNLRKGLSILLIGTAIVLFSTMRLVVPMIESISQRSAIEFFERQQGKAVYLKTYGYKSYAHYFYGRIQPENTHNMQDQKLTLSDKPIMISCKVNKEEKFKAKYPNALRLSEKGGFVFYTIEN